VASHGPQTVLVIHSFGREIEPYATIDAAFRSELARGSTGPLTILEASLDAGQPGATDDDQVLVDYLRERFRNFLPDVVVSFGPPAARFYVANRHQMFPAIPYVMAGQERRIAQLGALRAGDAAVTSQLDFPRFLEQALSVLPDVRNVAVAAGDSPLERFWVEQIRKDLAAFAARLNFVWLNGLSIDELQKRVATLPPHSAIFYAAIRIDGAGVPQERSHALRMLHAKANAPIFGLYESELGNGVVGGPYASQTRRGVAAAQAALRALRGESAAEPFVTSIGVEAPVYDGRELKRWGIDQARLPRDATVRFRPPSVWDENRVEIVAFGTLLILQSLLIAALVVQRRRRRQAEIEARDLGGRLITAYEDERRRLARELHDDVTQRLARLSIDAAQIQRGTGNAQAGSAAACLRDDLVKLSEDVHALAYQLHPSVLEDLGLVEALKAESDRMSRHEAIGCRVDLRSMPPHLPKDVALCLFRIAQEAMRNVVRHANARKVDISLAFDNGGLQLVVADDGSGFAPFEGGERPSLGLASMRERVRLLGGTVDVDSAPGRGTTVMAWVPLGAGA
jgi:signal transduction histidine kinase